MNLTRWARTKARRTLGSLIKVMTSAPVVALTFDDGPDPDSTPQLLEILGANQARATFFMVGQSVERHSGLVQRMAEQGHALGSHSWDHSAFPLLSSRERGRQLRACSQVLKPFGASLFRPPYGEQTLSTRLDAWRHGYEVIGWSVTSEDWHEPSAAVIADVLVKRMRPGDIVLLHDTIFDRGAPRRGPQPDRTSWVDRQSMLKALDMVFRQVGQSIRFVTVPELLRYGSPCYSYWFKQTADSKGLGRIETFLQGLG